MPDSSLPASSSRALHSMPLETTPPRSRSAICMPPGSTAPSCASTTRPPAAGTFGAPHTTSCSRVPSNTRDQAQLVALGMRARAAHLGDHHALEAGAEALHALDLETGARQTPRDLGRIEIQPGELHQPCV